MTDAAYNFVEPWMEWNEWIDWITVHEDDPIPQVAPTYTLHSMQVPVSTTSTISTPLISEFEFNESIAEVQTVLPPEYPVPLDTSVLPSTLPSSELFSSSSPAPTPHFECKSPNCTNELNGLPPIVGPDRDGRKQHICHIPGCDRRYHNPKNLRTHSHWHTGKGSRLCHTCGLGFKRKSELERHLDTHIGYYPYSCSICFKNFTHLDSFNRHMARYCKVAAKTKEANIIDTENTVQSFYQSSGVSQDLQEYTIFDAPSEMYDYIADR